MRSGEKATFIGIPDICDYQDFITAEGKEQDFFLVLVEELKKNGIRCLELADVRPDSKVLKHLVPLCESLNLPAQITPTSISLEMKLPCSWDDYLSALDKKQRHEIRRKLRRIDEAGNVNFALTLPRDNSARLMEDFLTMFPLSRQDKADFLSERMGRFFHCMGESLAKEGILRFGILSIDDIILAIVLLFDYNNSLYLYNSAYRPDYRHLSPGFVSKVLSIRQAIAIGRKRWDFLKGEEAYKFHLGGNPVTLYGVKISI